MGQNRKLDLMGMVVAIAAAAMWGSNYIAIKLALLQLPPLFISSFRLLVTGSLIVWFVKPPRLTQLFRIFLVSITMYTLNFALTTTGMQHVDAGLSAIVIEFEVPLTVILSVIFLHEKLNGLQVIGLLISFIGVVFVSYSPHLSGHLIPILLLLGGATSYAISILQLKQLQDVAAWTLVAYSSLFAGIQILVGSLLLEQHQLTLFMQMNKVTMLALLSYSIFGTFAFFIWTRLMHIYQVNQLMPISLLVCIFALIFGVGFFHEIVNTQIIVGAILTVFGVALVSIQQEDLYSFLRSMRFFKAIEDQQVSLENK